MPAYINIQEINHIISILHANINKKKKIVSAHRAYINKSLIYLTIRVIFPMKFPSGRIDISQHLFKYYSNIYITFYRRRSSIIEKKAKENHF